MTAFRSSQRTMTSSRFPPEIHTPGDHPLGIFLYVYDFRITLCCSTVCYCFVLLSVKSCSILGAVKYGCFYGLVFNFTFTFHFHALEKERATHTSILAWRIPGTGAWWAAVCGVAQSWTWLTRLSSSSSTISCYSFFTCIMIYLISLRFRLFAHFHHLNNTVMSIPV